MKKLIILRHAKSSWEEMDLNDYDRPLNSKGLTNAEEMGEFLLAKEGIPDLILTSSAKRAYDTANIIAGEIGYNREKIKTDKRLYHASVNDILKSIAMIPNDIKKCIVTGHNPGLTDLVNHFGVRLDSLPTASAVCFEFKADSWKNIAPENATLDWFQLVRNLM